MTSDTPAAGPALLEPKTDKTDVTPSTPPPGGRRTGPYWPLVALIAGALVVLGAWALWSPAGEVAQERASVASDHDSLIEMHLREQPAAQQQHDSLIEMQLRGQQGPPVVTPQHDSGIAAELKARSGGSDGCASPNRPVVVEPGAVAAC